MVYIFIALCLLASLFIILRDNRRKKRRVAETRADALSAIAEFERIRPGGLATQRFLEAPTDAQRIEMLEMILFGWAGSDSRTDDGAPPSEAQAVTLVIADALHDWRNLPKDAPPSARTASVEALIRNDLARRGPRQAAPSEDPGDAPLSLNEIDSLYRMVFFGHLPVRGRNEAVQRRILLDGVANRAPFDRIDAAREAARADLAARDGSRADWLARIGGDASANHLIADGVLPFLQSLDAPDIELWHDLATQFHGMGGDRTDAALWIVEQPDCDRATAWHFIAGFISWDCLEAEISQDARRDTIARRFDAVIGRWNAGFYRYHSLPHFNYHDDGHHGFGAGDLGDVLTGLEAEYGLAPFTRPEGFDIDLTDPVDDLDRSRPTGLRFDDTEGLYLPEGTDWARPEWRP